MWKKSGTGVSMSSDWQIVLESIIGVILNRPYNMHFIYVPVSNFSVMLGQSHRFLDTFRHFEFIQFYLLSQVDEDLMHLVILAVIHFSKWHISKAHLYAT